MHLGSEKPHLKWETPQLPPPLSVSYVEMGCRYQNNLQNNFVAHTPSYHQQSLDMAAQRKDTQFFWTFLTGIVNWILRNELYQLS